MLDSLRQFLRRQLWWVQFQELNREGWRAAWRRRRVQRLILDTPPVRTGASGRVEVRVMTWRRDWVNQVWALKSFYAFAGVDYPLVIHDGGLLAAQVPRLLAHFPDAAFVPKAEADERVPAELVRRGYARSVEFRRKSPMSIKLFDYYLASTADHVLMIDSDVVFFRRPDVLVAGPDVWPRNLFNRDADEWYSAPADELHAEFGVRPVPRVNAGLALIRRESVDFAAAERYLANPKLFADVWLSEQTIHALCSTVYGLDLLDDRYRLGGPPGVTADMVCKHYPGDSRPLLYSEGMRHLRAVGFLDALKRGGRPT